MNRIVAGMGRRYEEETTGRVPAAPMDLASLFGLAHYVTTGKERPKKAPLPPTDPSRGANFSDFHRKVILG